MNPKYNPQGVKKGDICTIMPGRRVSEGWKLKKLVKVQVMSNPSKAWRDQKYADAEVKILQGEADHSWNGTRKQGKRISLYVDCLQPERDTFPIF